MRATLKVVGLAVAFCALHIGVAGAQTDPQPVPLPEAITLPGIIVAPPWPWAPPTTLLGGQPPANQDAQTCPATDLKKLELLIG